MELDPEAVTGATYDEEPEQNPDCWHYGVECEDPCKDCNQSCCNGGESEDIEGT
jgi:hypothetical protein